MPPKQQQQEVIENGTFVYQNGDIYKGEYVKENDIPMRQGRGTYIAFQEESKQFEEIPEDVKQQPIPSRYDYDIIKLDGQWQKDVFVEGEIIYNNGAKYNGKLDGINYVSGGTYMFPNGTIYTGDFQNNLLHGTGTVKTPDGQTFGPGIYRNNYGEGLKM